MKQFYFRRYLVGLIVFLILFFGGVDRAQATGGSPPGGTGVCILVPDDCFGSPPVLTVKLEAKGAIGDFNDTEVTVKTGEAFTLRWSSTSASLVRATVGVNPVSAGCPPAGTPLLPFWPFTFWRFFDPPSGGTQALSAPASPVECTYYATALSDGGPVTDQVIIRVAPPPTLSFSIIPITVPSGANFTLSWVTTNATGLTGTAAGAGCPLADSLTPVDTGSKIMTAPSVSAQVVCTYSATATGPGGSVSRNATVTVRAAVLAPTLTGIVPGSGIVGAVVPVTLTGANFAAGATINAGAGIAVTNVVVVSPTQITATFTIASTAATGPRSITVTSGGVTTGPVTFTVNPLGGGGGALPTSCGLLVCFSYDPKVIILPPPGFTRIIKPFISEVAP